VLKLAGLSSLAFGAIRAGDDGDERWLHRLLYAKDVTAAQAYRVVHELYVHCHDAFAQHPLSNTPVSKIPKWFFDQDREEWIRAYARGEYRTVGTAPLQVFPGFESAAAAFIVRILGKAIPPARHSAAIATLAAALLGEEGRNASDAYAQEELRSPTAIEEYREKKHREWIESSRARLRQ
jgi:hypothetical protein